ncbi:MAG: NTP transferase domain-containing protein [Spirochaetales bacterium]|nr:NTP transferase domain-containing protein [Spirochaetales bacterium]
MKAVLLNSGIGSRMGTLTEHKPKCLVELKENETVLSRQITQLVECGIKDILITIGPFGNIIPDYVKGKFPGLRACWVRNERYDSTNYIVSMHLADNELRDDILLMHGDMVFDTEVLKKMISSEMKDLAVIDTTAALPEKDFKCRTENGIIREIGITVSRTGNIHFLLPMYKLSARFMIRWMDEIKRFVKNGAVGVYAENAFNAISGRLGLYPLDINGMFCMEVDTCDDLERARKRIT